MKMWNYRVLGFILITAICVLQFVSAKNCNKSCQSCPTTLQCAPGVNLIEDECGCCKVCARQLHESCDANNPCDKQKNLYCSFGETNENNGICVSTPGRSCFLDGKLYLSGETFARGCKFVCTCIDADISCSPLCPSALRIPRDCMHPHLVRKPGQCCSEWTCDKSSENKKQLLKQTPDSNSLLNRLSASQSNEDSPFSGTRGRFHKTLHLRVKNECVLQTTQWSPCSKTCGWGVSERVTNGNKACKLRTQTRLCQIRPCGESFSPQTKQGKKCSRSIKGTKPVRYSFSGCKSKVFIPKYCGTCKDGRVCSPERTKTVSVTFRCDDGFSFKKRMMQIKSCSCRDSSSRNDIFSQHE